MEAKAKILGHPIHQMLIPFPFGLLATAVIFDIIYMIWGNPTFALVAFWMMVAGAIGAVIAAPFGLIDWMGIPSGTRATPSRASGRPPGAPADAPVSREKSVLFPTDDRPMMPTFMQ